MWYAALRCIWPLFVLTETGFNKLMLHVKRKSGWNCKKKKKNNSKWIHESSVWCIRGRIPWPPSVKFKSKNMKPNVWYHVHSKFLAPFVHNLFFYRFSRLSYFAVRVEMLLSAQVLAQKYLAELLRVLFRIQWIDLWYKSWLLYIIQYYCCCCCFFFYFSSDFCPMKSKFSGPRAEK